MPYFEPDWGSKTRDLAALWMPGIPPCFPGRLNACLRMLLWDFDGVDGSGETGGSASIVFSACLFFSAFFLGALLGLFSILCSFFFIPVLIGVQYDSFP